MALVPVGFPHPGCNQPSGVVGLVFLASSPSLEASTWHQLQGSGLQHLTLHWTWSRHRHLQWWERCALDQRLLIHHPPSHEKRCMLNLHRNRAKSWHRTLKIGIWKKVFCKQRTSESPICLRRSAPIWHSTHANTANTN